MSVKDTEIVVIGGGIAGIASAFYLTKNGKKVVLLEKGGIASGSSGANAAFALAMYRPPGPLLDMGIASLSEYDHLGEEIGRDIEFERCGLLTFIETPDLLEEFKIFVEERNRAGLPELRLIDKQELLDLEPNASSNMAGAMFNPTDGHLNPMYLTHGLAEKTKALGADIYSYTTATEIKVKNNAVKSVVTDKGDEIRTKYIVNAGGINAHEIGKMVGLSIPIKANKQQFLVSQKAPGFIRYPFLTTKYKKDIKKETKEGTTGFVANYSKAGNIILGGVNQFVGEDDRTTQFLFESTAKNAIEYIPRFRELKIIRSFAKYYIHTPDFTPILGEVDELEGYIMASGNNDYGISLGAITGKLVSELICNGETSIPIEILNLRRFR